MVQRSREMKWLVNWSREIQLNEQKAQTVGGLQRNNRQIRQSSGERNRSEVAEKVKMKVGGEWNLKSRGQVERDGGEALNKTLLFRS